MSGQKIFIIAGESSGDALGARLMAAVEKRAGGGLSFKGVGGPLMEKQGLRSLYPMTDLCVMGILEILKDAPRLLKLVKEIVEKIEAEKPDILITVDLPDFNFRVAALLKKRGLVKTRIVHYVAPTVWAWRPGRAKKIAKFLDGLICLFPFEPPYFTAHGLRAVCAGHSLVENSIRGDGRAFRMHHSIPLDAPVLGVFFGSRHGELNVIKDIFADAIDIISVHHPNLQLVVPTLPHLESDMRHVLSRVQCNAVILTDPSQKWQAFAAMDAAMAMSGTIGLELAYAGTPHVIAYRANPVSWAIFRRVARVRFAHLANIMINRAIVPEYLQSHCNAPEISQGVLKLLDSKSARDEQITEFQKIAALLGAGQPHTPSERAADFVLEILQNDQPRLSSGT